MPISSNVLKFRPRTELRDLCAPDREADEKLLRVIDQYAAEGRVSYAADDAVIIEVGEAPPTASAHFVSEYLTRPLRSEQEVRASREPRIERAEGLLECVARQTGLDAAFRKIIGGV